MAKRNSLSDEEVAFIKSLLARKSHSNQQIAGLINRSRGGASNDINGGRISNIKNDEILKYVPIKPASKTATDAFLEKFEDTINSDPLSDSILHKLFPVKPGGAALDITETDQIECKKSFDMPMKTVAAFANNKGGYFLFGVEDKTWKIEGLTDKKFENHDWKKLNQSIRSALGMDIPFTQKLWLLEGKKVGILYIPSASIKPVIFINSSGNVAQGHIYYRYHSEDRLIAPADLQRLIEGRIRQLSETVLMKHISNILKFGIENTAVMNTLTGEVSGKGGMFLIDESIVPKLSFIREGDFQEKDGAPALRLVGEVQATNSIVVKKGKEALTDVSALEDFINQSDVQDPAEYVKHLAHTQVVWLPLFYYMKKANLDKSAAITLLDKADGKKSQVVTQKKRLNSGKLPKPSGKKTSYSQEIADLKSGADLASKNKQQISRYFWAILHIEKSDITKNLALELLRKNYDRMYKQGTSNDKSLYRMAASKIDALFFAD